MEGFSPRDVNSSALDLVCTQTEKPSIVWENNKKIKNKQTKNQPLCKKLMLKHPERLEEMAKH